MENIGNLLVAQSGGPTAVINATLAGIIEESKSQHCIDKIYGALNGIEGVFKENLIDLSNVDTQILAQTPSAYLGSCRRKLKNINEDSEEYEKIFMFFSIKNIKYFLYIGGNDSMDTVFKLSEYAKKNKKDTAIIGIPKTIDNDLDITDHTPGFGSAAKYIATTINEISKDSQVYDLKSVTIVEIMGRNAGWLTAASALARLNGNIAPHLIYLPESNFDFECYADDINKLFNNNIKNIVVVISEGISNEKGTFICEMVKKSILDSFGHKSLSGAGKVLEEYTKEKIGCKVRSVELNVCQRCSAHLLSKTDIDESILIGKCGVQEAIKGDCGKMMTFKRLTNIPYKIKVESVDITTVANIEKKIPLSYIKNKNDITDELIEYLKPLIKGEVDLQYENGIPKTL